MNMSYKQKFLVTITIVITLLGGLIYLSYVLFNFINESGASIRSSRDELALLLAKKKQIVDISKEYDTVKDAIPLLNEALLHKNDTLSFIVLVEKIAAQTNVKHKVEAVVDSGATEAKGLPYQLFNLNLTGNFNDVLKFIYFIENEKPYASLQSIQINAGVSGTQNKDVSLSPFSVTARTSIKVYTQ